MMKEEIFNGNPVACIKCGRKAARASEWATDGHNNFICDLCYLSSLFPGIRECYREMIDNGRLPSEK